MGYYSQVALCVSKKVEIPEATRTIMDSIDFNQKSTCNGSTLFIAQCLKWYDSSPEIRHLIKWMDSLDDEEYTFIRIGENWDDIERRGGYYDNPFMLGIVREFSYDNH